MLLVDICFCPVVEIICESQSSLTSTTFSLCTHKVLVTMGFVKKEMTLFAIPQEIVGPYGLACKLIKWKIMLNRFSNYFQQSLPYAPIWFAKQQVHMSSHARRTRQTTKCLLKCWLVCLRIDWMRVSFKMLNILITITKESHW